jgi:DNA-directed RNA polymerase subunit RPC12/RpoP
MFVVALHRRYQRTCKDCGHSRILTRRQAQYRPKPPGRVLVDGSVDGVLDADSLVEEQAEIADELKKCPNCGSDRFVQRAVTKKHPADARATILRG